MNMSGDSGTEVSGSVKFAAGWVLCGLLGSAMLTYPEYDKKGTFDVLTPVLGSIAGPFTMLFGLLVLSDSGYTTIQIKEKK